MGELPLKQRYAVDQILTSVVSGMDYMWADNGQGPIFFSQPGSWLHKSTARIQVINLMAGTHPDQICVIFFGTGKRISNVKKMA